jgi:hypothetical protein
LASRIEATSATDSVGRFGDRSCEVGGRSEVDSRDIQCFHLPHRCHEGGGSINTDVYMKIEAFKRRIRQNPRPSA